MRYIFKCRDVRRHVTRRLPNLRRKRRAPPPRIVVVTVITKSNSSADHSHIPVPKNPIDYTVAADIRDVHLLSIPARFPFYNIILQLLRNIYYYYDIILYTCGLYSRIIFRSKSDNIMYFDEIHFAVGLLSLQYYRFNVEHNI
jgi:hypothetical protein